MATATPKDSRANHAMAQAMVQEESTVISAKVGLHALAKLADMMPQEEFAAFLDDAVHEATTGQAPEESEGSEK